MAEQRKFFVGGNWKMNGCKASIDELVKMLNEKGLNPNTGLHACFFALAVEPLGVLDTQNVPFVQILPVTLNVFAIFLKLRIVCLLCGKFELPVQ